MRQPPSGCKYIWTPLLLWLSSVCHCHATASHVPQLAHTRPAQLRCLPVNSLARVCSREWWALPAQCRQAAPPTAQTAPCSVRPPLQGPGCHAHLGNQGPGSQHHFRQGACFAGVQTLRIHAERRHSEAVCRQRRLGFSRCLGKCSPGRRFACPSHARGPGCPQERGIAAATAAPSCQAALQPGQLSPSAGDCTLMGPCYTLANLGS